MIVQMMKIRMIQFYDSKSSDISSTNGDDSNGTEVTLYCLAWNGTRAPYNIAVGRFIKPIKVVLQAHYIILGKGVDNYQLADLISYEASTHNSPHYYCLGYI